MRSHWHDKKSKRRSEDEDEDDFDIFSEGIRIIGTTVLFYEPVNSQSVLGLNAALRTVAMVSKQRAMLEEREPAPIRLRICSSGGYLDAGLAAMETVRNCSVPVTTVIEGGAASAATLISVVGKRRLITRNSFMLIHQLSSGFWGTYEQIKDEMKNLDVYMSRIKDVYRQFTRVPPERLDEILKHDLWFTAEESLSLGLVDEIEG